MTSLLDLAKHRYTAKHYDPTRHVSEHDLHTLLEILRYTPSSINMQPWHFVVVDNRTQPQLLLPAVDEYNHVRIVDSTYTIVFCAKSLITLDDIEQVIAQEDKDGRFPDPAFKEAYSQQVIGKLLSDSSEERARALNVWASHQLYIALGQILYAAADMGIDSTAIGGFNSETLDRILDLPAQNLNSRILLTLGYHSDRDENAKRKKSRLPAESLFTFIK